MRQRSRNTSIDSLQVRRMADCERIAVPEAFLEEIDSITDEDALKGCVKGDMEPWNRERRSTVELRYEAPVDHCGQ